MQDLMQKYRRVLWGAYFSAWFGYLLYWNYFSGNVGEHPPLFGRISVFGAMVAAAILLFMGEARVWAIKHSLDWNIASSALLWMIFLGAIGSHVLDILLYAPAKWRIIFDLESWRGSYSSLGGIFTALPVGIIYFRMKKVDLIRYADMTVYAFTACWLFGRLGCFSAHDHPGEVTNFFLGLPLVEGGVIAKRHELGLYELLATIVIFIGVTISLKKPRFDGFVVAVVSMSYAFVRFFLDFLRIRDGENPETRYANLTPAQWFCFALFAIGLWIYLHKRPVAPVTNTA